MITKPAPQAPDASSEVEVILADCPSCFADAESQGRAVDHEETWATRWRPGSGVFGMGRYYQRCHACQDVRQVQLWS